MSGSRALPSDERALGAVGADGGSFEFAQSGRRGARERLPVHHGCDWCLVGHHWRSVARDFAAPLNAAGRLGEGERHRKRRGENGRVRQRRHSNLLLRPVRLPCVSRQPPAKRLTGCLFSHGTTKRDWRSTPTV